MITLDDWGQVELINWNISRFPWEDEVWPISFAVLWIGCRRRKPVERIWQTTWERKALLLDEPIQQDPQTFFRDAQLELWQALSEGKLEAEAAFANNQVATPIAARLWTPQMRFDKQSGLNSLEYESDTQRAEFLHVTVSRCRMLHLWPDLVPEEGASSTASDSSMSANVILEQDKPKPRKRGPANPASDRFRAALKLLPTEEIGGVNRKNFAGVKVSASWASRLISDELKMRNSKLDMEIRKPEL